MRVFIFQTTCIPLNVYQPRYVQKFRKPRTLRIHSFRQMVFVGSSHIFLVGGVKHTVLM